jgi:DMSO/TMAO reductase YedYZ molybdopterin-dependent catalytic subunit
MNNKTTTNIDPTGHRICDLDCQRENEQVDQTAIHYGESYGGSCWGAKDCLGNANLGLQGTYQAGVGGSAFLGVGVRADLSVAMDNEGDLALLFGIGGGGYTSAGYNKVGPFFTKTNAPSVDNLSGWSVQVGGQIGETASIGYEHIIFSNEEQIYHGESVGGGSALMAPFPGEMHGTFEHTWMLDKLNLFDMLIGFITD